MNKSILALMVCMGISLSANAANNDEWWEYSTEMEGMGGISMPAQKDCYKKDNIAPSGGEDCTSSNVKQSGNKYSADFSCKDGTSGHMEGMKSGKESSFKMTAKQKGESMTMTQKGKMVGSCNWATDSNEAKACAAMNKSVSDNKADANKQCEEALKEDKFEYFIGGQKVDASVNLAGKSCGGAMDTGCPAQRPKMCIKVKDYLKDITGNGNGFKKVMSKRGSISSAGADLAKQCGFDTVAANKNFCSEKMKNVKGRGDYQQDVVDYCENDAKALYSQHCAGRDYTAQTEGGYGTICSAYGKPSAASGRDYTAERGSSSSGDASKGNNPVDSAVKGVKKLKDVFGF